MPEDPTEPRRPRLLLHAFSTFATGGPQVRFASIANHFGRRYRHAIIAMDGNLSCRERLDPRLHLQLPDIEVRRGRNFGNIRPFRDVLKRMRPDLLITYNWGAIDWAIADAGELVPHLHAEDGFGPEERSRQLPRRVWTRRLVLRRRQVVLPSQTLLSIARDQWRLDPARLRYVPNGIDLARFAPGSPSEAGPVVGTVAALRAEKNLGRLIRAYAACGAPGRLVIVGDGPERSALEGLARELGAAVEFTGHVERPAALIAGFDVFALSSDTEQMPLSLLEAMATGLPVVATDVGDIRAMLAPENAPFVTALDDAALASALGRLLSNPAQRAELGHANRMQAERHFNQETMFAAWGALLDGGR